ncbi:hypothetical protein IWQ56_007025, partial [Coemansia nantahalensis]
LALLGLVNVARAGISMVSPCARFSDKCEVRPELPPYQRWDANINLPISSFSRRVLQPLCKHVMPWTAPVAEWSVDRPVTVSFAADAGTTGGGHCEFSLSYDGGETFVVVHQVLNTCFLPPPGAVGSALETSYTFTLPAGLPSIDHAVFAWSYANSTGDSAFYMNCAD